MIEEALLKSNYIGKDGFSWWLGQVAQKNCWKDKSSFAEEKGSKGDIWAARCKVRIVGHHTFDGNILADEDLPWAQIMLDPSFGSVQGGVGGTINLKGGETCFGFFLDGDDGQQPVVVGLLYRSDGVKNLIDEKTIAKDKSSSFKSFTGHPGNNIPSTQRSSRVDKPIDPAGPPTETPPLSKIDSAFAYNSGLDFGIPSLSGTKIYPQFGDRLIFDPASVWAVAKKADITVTLPNGCQNNFIGQITQGLQDFMAVTNGLDKYLNVYIDPVLNEITDITNTIRSAARSISGVVKLIINNLRSTIFKCIVWAFRKLVGFVIPIPQQTIILEAMKKILDIIFCILQKINLMPFIENLLGGLVDKIKNAPLCAAEQWTAGILQKLMDEIEKVLASVMSGISWLTGGLGTISGILNQASSLASQIFSFLECTGLACKTPSVWASKFGPSEKEADDWKKAVENVNVFKGLSKAGTAIEDAIGQTELYDPLGIGGLFDTVGKTSCSSKVNNPQNQTDLMPMPIGSRWAYCIPPEIRILGDGVGARAIPIVNENKKIFSIKVINGGVGYFSGTTTVVIVDNSGYGLGATAEAIVDDGVITSIYLTNTGSGYCKGNLTGIGTTGDIGISSYVSGDIEKVIVKAPGYGYTTGDRINDGKNIYEPIVSPGSGAIVSIIQPSNPIGGFIDTPTLTINTNTGVAAEVIPVMRFTPSYTGTGSTTISTAGIAVTSVIDCI